MAISKKILEIWHFGTYFFFKKCMSHIYMSHTGIFFVAKWQKFAQKYTYTISFKSTNKYPGSVEIGL
jgi:hypothetical protein